MLSLILLPVALTRALNQFAHGYGSAPSFAEERAWLRREGSFNLNAEEEALLQNLSFLAQQIEQLLLLESSSELVPLICEFYGLRERLSLRRAQEQLAGPEVVNSALLAVRQFLMKDGSPQVLEPFREALEGYLDNAWEKGILLGLPSEEKGLTAFAQGLREWDSLLGKTQSEAEEWNQALRWLAWGSQAIEDWQSRYSWLAALPFELRVPEMQRRLNGLSLTLEQREGLQDQLDSLEDLTSLEVLWESAQKLAQERPALETSQEDLLAALLAALQETLPDQALRDYLNLLPGAPPRIVDHVHRYLESGEFAWLYSAVDLLLVTGRQRQDEAI